LAVAPSPLAAAEWREAEEAAAAHALAVEKAAIAARAAASKLAAAERAALDSADDASFYRPKPSSLESAEHTAFAAAAIPSIGATDPAAQDRKSTRLNSSHSVLHGTSRMPSSA
jgi:hypothetical protein